MSFDYSEWLIDNAKLSQFEIKIIERYLLGSLAIGASKRSDGFIEALGITNSVLAEAFLGKLKSDCRALQFKDSAAEVESFVEKQNCPLWEQDEFYVCYKSNKSELLSVVDNLSESKEIRKSKLSEDAKSLVKARFQEVDAVFRHLRNALAHGCFRMEVRGGQNYLFFFNVNSDGNMSAVGLLSETTLDSWYQKCCDLAERRL